MTRPLHRITRWTARISAFVTRNRTLLQAIVGSAAVMLGFWGWHEKQPPHSLGEYLNTFFRTLQLVTLQFPTQFANDVPWQLQIARLLLPLVAVAASINVLVGSMSRPFRLALLPRARDHAIVIGDAKLTEAALVKLAERGEQIVVVAPSHDPTRRDALEGLGLTLVDADPEQPGVWKALNVKEAAALLLTGRNDLLNLNLAMSAVQAAAGRDAARQPLPLAVLIEREDLARELDAALDGIARRNGVRYHRLSPDKEGVRLELAQLAPVFAKTARDAASHVLIAGLNGQWEQVVGQILMATQDHPTKRPILSFMVSSEESARLDRWRAARPDLELVMEMEQLASVGLMPAPSAVADWRARRGAPHLAVVMTGETDAVAVALALRRPGGDFDIGAAPVLVRQEHEDRLLAALAATSVRDRDFTGLHAFGGLIRAESIARVLDRKGDDLAMALHASYLDALKDLPAGSPAAVAAWDDLPENMRDANRASADHLPILLASECLKAPVDVASLPAETIDRLARVEHRRWMTERILRGWKRGEARDDVRRLHPSIVDFDALPSNERQKDVNAVLNLMRLGAACSA